MKRTVVIHQPDFLPWLGYFDRLLHADLLIVLDHVQFVTGTSRSWMHRDLIKTSAGPKWLSLNVQKAPLGTPIRDIVLSPNPSWRCANLNLLRENYRQAPFFAEVYREIERLYVADHTTLLSLNLAGLDILDEVFDIKTPRLFSSDMTPVGKSNAMLVDLLRKAGATHYISGLGAKAYLDTSLFQAAGIDVLWQNFDHPIYPQCHGEFIPKLSAIDALFNCGRDKARTLLSGVS